MPSPSSTEHKEFPQEVKAVKAKNKILQSSVRTCVRAYEQREKRREDMMKKAFTAVARLCAPLTSEVVFSTSEIEKTTSEVSRSSS